MRDVLFIQFYAVPEHPRGTALADLVGVTALLCNGFSFVWNKCKNMGDFFWVKEVSDFTDSTAMLSNQLPITKGTAYVSVWYSTHLAQVYTWALIYPEMQFIVGGHCDEHSLAEMESQGLPPVPNVRITQNLAEKEIFGMNEPSKEWNLEIPDDLLPQAVNAVMFTYTLERKCYWGKCNFCDESFTGSKLERFSNDASSLYVPETNIHSKMIWLYEPSVSPKSLRRYYKDLPARDDVHFSMYYRGDHADAEALREVFRKGEGPKPANMVFAIGVEFPSNRMLEWMKKGTTVESILETMKVICEYNSNVNMLLISGFDNLLESDVVEATSFFNTVKEYNQQYGGNVFVRFTSPLLFFPNTNLTEEYMQIEEKGNRMRKDSMGSGIYMMPLDEKQRELNERVVVGCREAFPDREFQLEYDRVIMDKLFPPDSSGRSVYIA